MSEQQAQGADAAIDLNNELKTRREKLAALREQGDIVVELLPGETACEGPLCDRKLVLVGEHWIIEAIQED